MNPSYAVFLIDMVKMQLALATPLARSAWTAVPMVLASISNPVGMYDAAQKWHDLSEDLADAVEIFDGCLPSEEDWAGAGRDEFDRAMTKFKSEWSQLSSAGETFSNTMYGVLVSYISYYLGLVTLWLAINAYLRALLPALVPPTTGGATVAMEGAGVTGATVTATAFGSMKAAASPVGLALAGGITATLAGIMQTDTRSGSAPNDFEDIRIPYPKIQF